MSNKLKYDPMLNYREVFNSVITKSRAVDDKINDELQKSDGFPFDLMEKYGDKFKKLLLTTGIDYIMMGLPDNDKKRAKATYVSVLNILKRFMLYKDGLRVITHNDELCDIMPLHHLVDDNDLCIKLKTEERHNDCHQGSWNLMSAMSKVEGKKLVSGFIYGAHEDCVYPHTWIEFENNGENFVADYTLNAVMNKDFYYSLKSIDRDNISEISEDDFNNEKETVENLVKTQNFDKRVYLFFRDDLVENYSDKFQIGESGK